MDYIDTTFEKIDKSVKDFMREILEDILNDEFCFTDSLILEVCRRYNAYSFKCCESFIVEFSRVFEFQRISTRRKAVIMIIYSILIYNKVIFEEK